MDLVIIILNSFDDKTMAYSVITCDIINLRSAILIVAKVGRFAKVGTSLGGLVALYL